MKKILPLLVALAIGYQSFGQRRLLDVTIVFKNADSLHTKMRMPVNLFNKNLIKPLSFVLNEMITYDESGKKKVIKSKEVDALSFTDYKGNPRLFVSEKFTRPIDVRAYLVEVMETGKVDWYREYYPHGYDHSVMISEILVKEGEPAVYLEALKNNKKRLKQLMAGNPETFAEIDQFTHGDMDQLREIVEIYNQP